MTDLVHPSIGGDVLTSRALLMRNQELVRHPLLGH